MKKGKKEKMNEGKKKGKEGKEKGIRKGTGGKVK